MATPTKKPPLPPTHQRAPTPHAAPKNGSAGPDVIDGALNGASAAANMVGLATFIAPPAVGLAGGALGSVGNFTGVSGLSKAGSALSAGSKAVSAATVGDAAKAVGFTPKTGNIVQRAFEAVADAFEPVNNFLGIGTSRSASHFGKAQKHFDKAQGRLGELAIDKLPSELQPHFEAIHTEIGAAKNVGHVDFSRINEAVGGIEEVLKKNEKLAANLGKPAKKFLSSATEMAGHHSAALKWKNVSGSIKDAPSALASSNALHSTMSGAFIAMDGISMVSDARTFAQNLKTLRQMYADAKGMDESKVSSYTVLFSNDVPITVKNARQHIITNTLAKESMDLANMVLNIKQAANPHMSGMVLAGWMGANILGGLAVDAAMGQSILPLYGLMKDAENAGQPLPPEVIAKFIGEVNPDLKSRGGEENQFTAEIARQMAEEKLTLAEIMRENENGKIMLRINGLIDKAEKQKLPAVESKALKAPDNKESLTVADKAVTEASLVSTDITSDSSIEAAKSDNKANITHVERLHAPKEKHKKYTEPKDILGVHTAKIADKKPEQAQGASLT